jgi:hypothetical protein
MTRKRDVLAPPADAPGGAKTVRRAQRWIAGVFFVFWFGTLFAGADHPPPPGFLLLAVIVALCAGIVYWRVPLYLDWQSARRPRRYLRVLVDGVTAGLSLALLFMLLPGGEPSVAPRMLDRLIWFSVLGTLGAANALTIYSAAALLHKRAA